MLSNSSGAAARQAAPAIVILGGSGFIGSRLTDILSDAQRAIRIGDICPSVAFPHLWTECDVRRRESLISLFKDARTVINLAAEHRDDVFPLSRYEDVNVRGAENVCAAAASAGIGRIVFTSSAAVYGFQPRHVDESGPFAPFNAYGKTKWRAEAIYRAWAAEDPSRTLVIVRPTVVFGEGNRGNVYNLLQQIASGRFVMVGSGSNSKSMAYVGNIAAFLVHCLSLQNGVHIFNYVDGPDMTTRELVDHVRRCLGREGKLPVLPKRLALAGGHVLDVIARLSGRKFPISAIRIRKFCENTQFIAQNALLSGFTPPFTLAEGLARTIAAEFVPLPARGERKPGIDRSFSS